MREVVLEARGLLRGSSGPALQTFLKRHPGVHRAEANYLNESVTVEFDETVITQADVERLIEECGYHCGGEIVPRHLCAPEPGAATEHRARDAHEAHRTHPPPTEPAPATGPGAQLAHEMGHGAGMDMDAMVRDVRRRFWVTLALSLGMAAYSPMAEEVAMETADIVLMKSDPADVLGAIALSRATVRKMKQNLWWAAGYNILAFPIAGGVFYPRFGILLSPWIAAVSMSGSSLIVAVNALLLKWTRLPGIRRQTAGGSTPDGIPTRRAEESVTQHAAA